MWNRPSPRKHVSRSSLTQAQYRELDDIVAEARKGKISEKSEKRLEQLLATPKSRPVLKVGNEVPAMIRALGDFAWSDKQLARIKEALFEEAKDRWLGKEDREYIKAALANARYGALPQEQVVELQRLLNWK